MSFAFNPFTGTLDIVSKEPIIAGTTDGQMAFWDDTLKKWTYEDTTGTIGDFTLHNDYNGTLRQELHNTSTGVAAMASMTVRNDANRRASLNMSGHGQTYLPPDSLILYNEGYGDTGFVTDGNKDFIWFADPLDRHTTASIDHEMMRLVPNGRLKVGRALDTLPIRTIDIAGNVNFDNVEEPDATNTAGFTATLAGLGAGNVDNGLHYYAIIFVTEDGGQTGSYTSAYYKPVTVVDNTVDGQVLLEGIPISDDPRVTRRKIYRSTANGSSLTTNREIAEINNNTATTYVDNIADADQVTSTLIYRKANTTSSLFYLNNVLYMQATDEYHTSFGFAAGRANQTGHSWVAIGGYALRVNTTGNNNNAIGLNALGTNTTGSANNAIGANCLFGNVTGSNNIAIGFNALRNEVSANISNNVAIGYYCLRNCAQSNNYNSAVGHQAGYNFQGSYNIFMGGECGRLSTATTIGNYNIIIGYDSADNTTTGAARNTLIGSRINFPITNGTDQLVIGNIIYGTDVDGIDTTVSSGKIGIKTSTPNSTLQVSGSVSKPIVTKTANYTIDDTDYTILLDGSSNTVTATLPTAIGIEGRIYNIKCIDDTFTCDIATNGTETIDASSTNFELIKHETITIQSDNANWWVI